MCLDLLNNSLFRMSLPGVAAGEEAEGISTAKACVADGAGPSSRFGGSEEVELALERLFRAFWMR